MKVHIRERPLPKIGHRYDLVLDSRRTLTVVVERRGRRALLVSEAGSDAPNRVVTLDEDQATAVAAILTGARFSLETTHDDVGNDERSLVTRCR
jgi:K+/H+ antiporter YhaU regulatory subunit KhtT